MNPVQNAKAVDTALSLVKSHPMCGRIEDDGAAYVVYYPAGDFGVPYGGIRAPYLKQGGKAGALSRAVDRMERDWKNSFPGARQ